MVKNIYMPATWNKIIIITIMMMCILTSVRSSAQVVVNELHYNPDGSGDATEFIELWNIGSTNVSLANWYFSDGIDFVFGAGASIPAGGFAVIVKDTAAFSAMYPGVVNVYGPFLNGTGLKNSGETITLRNAASAVVGTVTYSDDPPWPVTPDGDGPSLELVHPYLPLDDADSWAASTDNGGTPGATNSTWLGAACTLDYGTVPTYPVNGDTVYVLGRVVAPTSVVSLTLHYTTNLSDEMTAVMYDDGAHNDSLAGDLIYGAALPSMPNATYVWYYFDLELADGMTVENPPVEAVDFSAPAMTVRLSYDGLHTDVVPKSYWQVATNTGVATSSRLYMYLHGEGEVYVDDVSIKYGSTEYIPNGDFTTNDDGWLKTGNHAGTIHVADQGYTSPGCEKIIAPAAGASSGNSLNCYTSPDLNQNSTIYTLTFAYRADAEYTRDWHSYYVGSRQWTDVCINELMGANETVLQDEDGDYSDWVEIYNTGTEPFNLYGCGLSDDIDSPYRWEFPNRVIQPNEYLVVFISDKDRYGSELHTSFKLSSLGEHFTLYAPNGILCDQVAAVPLPLNVSYGSYPDASVNEVYFATPTPGASNGGTTYSGIAEDPHFSRPGGYFTGSISVSLSVTSATAEIRYTIDGSTPTASSPLYSSPLTISSTTEVRARAYDVGLVAGNVVSHKYYSGTPSGVLLETPLPIIFLDSLGQSIPDEPKITARMGIICDPTGGVNSVTDPFNEYDGMIGLELRGKSSMGFAKKQYGLETRNLSGEQIDLSLLGYPAESDWVLNGPYSDKSLIRNLYAYYTERQMRPWAPRAQLCEVVLNGSYNGVYIFVENIKRANGRVDIAKLSEYENDEPDITGGYIVKVDKTDYGDVINTTATGTQLIQVYPKGDEVTTEQRNWLISYMNEFETAMFNAPANGVVAAVEPYTDVSSWVDNYVHVQFTKNIDGLRLSLYMYKDKNEKLVMGPQWDYNLSLGNANYLDGWRTNGWYVAGYGNSCCATPYWWREFLEDPHFINMCAMRWLQLRKNTFSTDNLCALFDSQVERLGAAADRNFQRWPVLGTYIWPNWYVANTHDEEIAWMRQWIIDRADWMDGEWDIVTADFEASTNTVHISQPVSFTFTGMRTPDNYYWNFGDATGVQSTVRNPAHSYLTQGFYTVILTVDNTSATAGYLTDTTAKTNYIHVIPEPGASILFLTFFIFSGIRKQQ